MANPVGRPTKYSSAILVKSQKYLDSCVDEYKEFHKTRSDTSNSFERLVSVKLPSAIGLALYLGITRSTLFKWQNEKPEFSDMLDMINMEQEQRLKEGGMNGDYNPTIAKLVLAKHGYTDRVDHTTKGQAIGAETQEKIDSALDHV